MRTKRIILAAFCIVFAAIPVSAQPAARTSAPLIFIKMPKFSIGDFPKKSVTVSAIQIMQTVWDSTRLGYVQKGMSNSVVAIGPAKPLTVFLQDHFDKLYRDDFRPGGIKLLLLIKDLRVSERTTFNSNHAYTRFNADAYLSADGSAYHFVTSVDTALVAMGADVTAWHGERIEKAIKLLIIRSLEEAKKLDLSQNAFSLEAITTKEKAKVNIPILQENVYAEGLYTSFGEFVQNKPSTTVYLPVKVTKDKISFVTTNQDNGIDTLAAWGICKNGELYKYHEGVLVPIEKQNNGFIISDYVEKVNRRNSNVAAGALIGGLAGGLLGAAIGSNLSEGKNKPVLVRNIPYIKKNMPEASSVDMSTGELTF